MARKHSHRWYYLMNIWPPLLGAGIRVKHVAPELRRFEVEMKLTFLNRNFVGTQFGGSLYAMTDAFYMLQLLYHLRDEFVVWDKGATIRFLKPGRGRVRASFDMPEELVEKYRQEARAQGKIEPVITVPIYGDDGVKIAEVDKVLYIRKKT